MFFSTGKFYNFWLSNSSIRIGIDLKCWIRTRIEINEDPTHWFYFYITASNIRGVRGVRCTHTDLSPSILETKVLGSPHWFQCGSGSISGSSFLSQCRGVKNAGKPLGLDKAISEIIKGTQAWNFFFDFFCRNRNLMIPRGCNTRFLKIVFDSAEIFDF